MATTKEEHTVDGATEQRDRSTRLNFSNPEEREAHIHAFFAWLPKILHEAPGIRWEHMPSSVMDYLIRSVADSPDTIPITLATGCAMDAAKEIKGVVLPLLFSQQVAKATTE